MNRLVEVPTSVTGRISFDNVSSFNFNTNEIALIAMLEFSESVEIGTKIITKKYDRQIKITIVNSNNGSIFGVFENALNSVVNDTRFVGDKIETALQKFYLDFENAVPSYFSTTKIVFTVDDLGEVSNINPYYPTNNGEIDLDAVFN